VSHVGVVFVSHSARIAEGLVELAAQMAAGVRLVAAGGTDDGRIGTSFDRVSAALAEADSGDGVVVLCDLGSAVLTAETALDFLDESVRSRVRVVDAPLVEGGVAAAVAAESGLDLAAVVQAAESARGSSRGDAGTGPASPPSPPAADDAVSDSAVLVNREGLHARPAADFVKLAAGFDARVTVNGVDAKSLLRIMALGLTEGDPVRIEATGAQAHEAVAALTALIRSGFGET
jgi:PTS hybrid protein